MDKEQVISETKDWKLIKTSEHSSKLVWTDDGVFGHISADIDHEDDTIAKTYSCPRGHTFETNNPIIIAVDGDAEYNTGPICGYCYVDWFKVNLNADEVQIS